MSTDYDREASALIPKASSVSGTKCSLQLELFPRNRWHPSWGPVGTEGHPHASVTDTHVLL